MTYPFRLVVFDVGSVLVEAGRTWQDDLEHAGFHVSPAELTEIEGWSASLPHRGTGEISSEEHAVLFAEASGGVFSVEDAQRISHGSLRAEYPGIGRVFDALDASSVPYAVLCNVNDEEWSRLFPDDPATAEFPTLLRIRTRFSSHLLALRKPDARIFRAVERETGYPGSAILFFDDRIENVEGARACNWTAEVIDHTGDTAEQMLRLLRSHAVIS